METYTLIKPLDGSNKMNSPLPLPVERAIRKLGNDIALARRRRRISQASLAERMEASVSTVRRMENGDVRVPIHFFARALHVFGEIRSCRTCASASPISAQRRPAARSATPTP